MSACSNSDGDSSTGTPGASSTPSVLIVEPVSGTGDDITTHILAASISQDRRDQNAAAAGAQYTVVACTNSAGATGTLYVGRASDTSLIKVMSGVTATASTGTEGYPEGYDYVLTFPNVTLFESITSSDGALQSATRLQVKVTDRSNKTSISPEVDVWVDSYVPEITPRTPANLCSYKVVYPSNWIESTVQLNLSAAPTSDRPLTFEVIPEGTTTPCFSATRTAVDFTIGVTFSNVSFPLGTSQITANISEPSGNIGSLDGTVYVGDDPIVIWVTPDPDEEMNMATDGNSGEDGWQGTLSVDTDLDSGYSVVFYLDGTSLGTTVTDSSGIATLSGTKTIPDGERTLTVQTEIIGTRGVGTATLERTVDTVAPDAPTNIAAAVTDRRGTDFRVTWIAPGDAGDSVAGYDVWSLLEKPDLSNFDSQTKVSIDFGATPTTPGTADGISVYNRLIETDYYFAVRAVDGVGNTSDLAYMTNPVSASFNSTILTGIGGDKEEYGMAIDGSTSINGDDYADLIVGSGNGSAVYIYFGHNDSDADTWEDDVTRYADVIITSTVDGAEFGRSVAMIGDIDSDGLEDIAIGSSFYSSGRGRVYIFKGRSSWHSSYSSAEADYIINVDPAEDDSFTNAAFGSSIARLGDFDGDGADDFAIGAPTYGPSSATAAGAVVIIRGVGENSTFPSTVTIPQTATTDGRAVFLPGETYGSEFGYRILGLGDYLISSCNGTSLLIAAPGSSELFMFAGETAASGSMTISHADSTLTGSSGDQTGKSLNFLGTFMGARAIGVGSPRITDRDGFASIMSLPFDGATVTIVDGNANALYDSFGNSVFGSTHAFSNVELPMIAGRTGIGVSSVEEGSSITSLYLLSKTTINAASGSSIDVATDADIVLSLPSDWNGTSSTSGPIHDLNNDGYVDFAIGEQDYTGGFSGRVIVFW